MATFGNTDSTGATGASFSNGSAGGSPFTAPGDVGEVTGLSVFAASGDATNIKGVIWRVSDGAVIAVTNTIAVGTTPDWCTGTFASNPTLVPSTAYLLGFVVETSTALYHIGTASGQGPYEDAGQSYASPTTFAQDGTDNWTYSIYATYTAGGGASTPLTASLSDSLIYG